MRHASTEHYPPRPSRHRSQHRHPETVSRSRRAVHALRSLATREAARKPRIDPLPFEVFEHKDSGGRPAQRTTLEYGPDKVSGVYLDQFRPLADEDETGAALGLPRTRVVGVIRNQFIPTPPTDPHKAAKDRHLQALNTTYILQARGSGLPPRCILMGFNTLQEVRRIRAAGGVPDLNDVQVRVLEPGQTTVLGSDRDRSVWSPYKARRDSYPDDPTYLHTADQRTSRKQSLIGIDADARVFVIDGLGDAEHPSKNGTTLVHGTLAEERTAAIPALQAPVYGQEPTAFVEYQGMPKVDPWEVSAAELEYTHIILPAEFPDAPGGFVTHQ